jgi:hypothetical protein
MASWFLLGEIDNLSDSVQRLNTRVEEERAAREAAFLGDIGQDRANFDTLLGTWTAWTEGRTASATPEPHWKVSISGWSILPRA